MHGRPSSVPKPLPRTIVSGRRRRPRVMRSRLGWSTFMAAFGDEKPRLIVAPDSSVASTTHALPSRVLQHHPTGNWIEYPLTSSRNLGPSFTTTGAGAGAFVLVTAAC